MKIEVHKLYARRLSVSPYISGLLIYTVLLATGLLQTDFDDDDSRDSDSISRGR